ncbi:MAG: hypothetical protein KatS3mg105_1910 [Gemmatales bacterium]|nr:MAG: hypothetical protein KatS3mg105_1910 [Gemmatales bacterium]
MLKSKFIPVAIDQAYQRRQKDAEGEFYRKIASQGPRNNFQGTTQGLYIATASGKLLVYNNNRGAERIKRLMKQALDQFKPEKVEPVAAGKPDPRYNPKPPVGGLVVRVRAKVLGGYPETDDPWQKIFQSAVSRDNLWISKAEHETLVRGQIPESLQKRLARFHLVDNTRGEPPMWREDEIRKLNLQLKDGRLTGIVHLETQNGDCGYQAEIYGIVETKAGQVTRFDLVAKGEFWGEGRYTRGAPKGKFPLAVTFELADGSDVADAVPPQGSRGWVQGYIRD